MKRPISTSLILILLITLFLCYCSPKKQELPLAFYYWKTTFALNSFEMEKLKTFQVEKLYIRFFDVDWNPVDKEAQPVALLQFKDSILPVKKIIPVVFITNRTLLQIRQENIEKMALNIYTKIKGMMEKNLRNQFKLEEIQLDCDWSPETREKFFRLIKELRKHVSSSHTLLSATIRLHQIKFFEKTGVPPVDKGMLMFYNMGKLDGSNTQNSILDLEIAKNYLENLVVYPLKLDIALPVFNWGVLKRRGKIVSLLNNANQNTFQEESLYKKISDTEFEVIKSHYLSGTYLYKKDQIRIEDVPLELLEESVKLLKTKTQTDSSQIVLYHLDVKNLKKYTDAQIQDLLTDFYH